MKNETQHSISVSLGYAVANPTYEKSTVSGVLSVNQDIDFGVNILRFKILLIEEF
ncbi:MAG: hypothetical protein ACRC80_29490 [Waterburya sp.]